MEQHHDRSVSRSGVADIEGQSVMGVVVHSLSLNPSPQKLYTGAAEFVDIHRTTGHAHDQREGRPADHGTAAGGERGVVGVQLQVGDARAARDGEIAAVSSSLSITGSWRATWRPSTAS